MSAHDRLLVPLALALLCASYQAQAAQIDCILHGNSPGERGIIDSTGAGCTDEDRQWYKDNKAKIDALRKQMEPATEREISRIKQETEANQRAIQEEYRAAATQQAAQRSAAQAANLRAQRDAYQSGTSLAPYTTYERTVPPAMAQPAPVKQPQWNAATTTKPTDPFAPAKPWESVGNPVGAGLPTDQNAAACIQRRRVSARCAAGPLTTNRASALAEAKPLANSSTPGTSWT